MASLGKRLLLPLSLLLSTSLAYAASNPFKPIMDISGSLFMFGSFSWIDPSMRGYAVKFLFFIVLLVLVNFGLEKINISDKKVRGVVSFAVSAISVIFMPNEVALFAGGQYGAIAGLIIAGALPAAICFLGYRMTKNMSNAWAKHGIRCLIWLVGLVALNAVAAYLGFSNG